MSQKYSIRSKALRVKAATSRHPNEVCMWGKKTTGRMNNFKKDIMEFKFILRQGSNLTFKVQASTVVSRGTN